MHKGQRILVSKMTYTSLTPPPRKMKFPGRSQCNFWAVVKTLPFWAIVTLKGAQGVSQGVKAARLLPVFINQESFSKLIGTSSCLLLPHTHSVGFWRCRETFCEFRNDFACSCHLLPRDQGFLPKPGIVPGYNKNNNNNHNNNNKQCYSETPKALRWETVKSWFEYKLQITHSGKHKTVQ